MGSTKNVLMARLVIHDASKMTPRAARRMVEWLSRQADALRTKASRAKLSDRFTARFYR